MQDMNLFEVSSIEKEKVKSKKFIICIFQHTIFEITNSLNFSFVQLPSIIFTAIIISCKDRAGNIVYIVSRTNTNFLTAGVFFKE